MIRTWTIIKKNFQILKKSPFSSLIVILGPLLLVILAGFAFSSFSNNIAIGIIGGEGELSAELTEKLGESHLVSLEEETDCLRKLKENELNLCILFPLNYRVGGEEEAVFYVDPSRTNLIDSVINDVYTVVADKTKTVSLDLTTALIEKLEKTSALIVIEEEKLSATNQQLGELGSFLQETENSLAEIKFSFAKEEFKASELDDQLEKLRDASLEAIALGKALEGADLEALTKLEEEVKEIDSTEINDLKSAISKTKQEIEDAEEVKNTVSAQIDTATVKLEAQKQKNREIATQLQKIEKEAAVTDFTASEIVTPLKIKVEPITEEKNYFHYIFPTLIMMIVLFTGLLLGAILIIVEKRSASFFRHSLMPINNLVFFLGTYLTCLLIVIIQLLVFFVFSTLFFEISAFSWLALPTLFFSASVFILLGILVGILFNSEETIILTAISLAFILLLFSSTILPIESMSLALRKIASLNPFLLGEGLLRESLFHGLVSFKLLYLGIGLAVLFVVVWWLYSLKQKN